MTSLSWELMLGENKKARRVANVIQSEAVVGMMKCPWSELESSPKWGEKLCG